MYIVQETSITSRIIAHEGSLKWHLCIISVMYKESSIEEIDVYA